MEVLICSDAASLSPQQVRAMGCAMPRLRRARWARCSHAGSARAMVAGYWLVQHGLTRYARTQQGTGEPDAAGGSIGQEWRIGPAGKPACPAAPHFSLTHTVELQVCAITEEPVGVDAERIVPEVLEALSVVMNPDEMRRVDAQPDPAAAGTRLWTAKEALIKRDGLGLGDAQLPQYDLSDDAVAAQVASRSLLSHWVSVAVSTGAAAAGAARALDSLTHVPAAALAAAADSRTHDIRKEHTA